MTHLERFRAVMNFQPVDRLPQMEWAPWWNLTLERWIGEGLPAADAEQAIDHFGLDKYLSVWFRPYGPGLPTPASHGAPIISSMDEYEKHLDGLYPDRPNLLAKANDLGRRQSAGELVYWAIFEGPFWYPRKMLGIEPHMYAFYDQPELMHRMNSDQVDYNIRQLRQLDPEHLPAFASIAEDMSYNNGPMLSKALFDEFLAPHYRRLVPVMKELGIRVFVDSDGLVDAMVPWLQEVGVEGIFPLERQAGVDANALREKHPDLLMFGHFDKLTMTEGEDRMRQEFERILPVMRSGGFIPSVDHQTPPGVSLDQYRCYLGLLREYTEKAAQ